MNDITTHTIPAGLARLYYWPAPQEFRVGHQLPSGAYWLGPAISTDGLEDLVVALEGIASGESFEYADATGLGTGEIMSELIGDPLDVTDRAAAMLEAYDGLVARAS